MSKFQKYRYLSARFIKSLVAALAMFSLLSCSSGFSVRSDEHPSADFSAFTTYGFFDPMGIEGGYNTPVFGKHFRAALDREMASRGYRPYAAPDLLINVTIRADDQVSVRTRTTPYMTGYYYDRPGSYYAGSGIGVGVAVGSRASVNSKAAIFIDFVDTAQHRLVWQGVAHVDITDRVAQHLRDAIFTSVNRVLEQYPHIAGN
jgi:hypothetical protein